MRLPVGVVDNLFRRENVDVEVLESPSLATRSAMESAGFPKYLEVGFTVFTVSCILVALL